MPHVFAITRIFETLLAPGTRKGAAPDDWKPERLPRAPGWAEMRNRRYGAVRQG